MMLLIRLKPEYYNILYKKYNINVEQSLSDYKKHNTNNNTKSLIIFFINTPPNIKISIHINWIIKSILTNIMEVKKLNVNYLHII